MKTHGRPVTRRTLLRGISRGAPALLALPPLDAMFTGRGDAWAAERDHRQGDFMDDWRRFAEARAETAAFLKGLAPAAADRIGLSGFFGPVTLAQYATHIVDHDIEHLSQLQACRAVVAHP
jgi:hypothetical protein